MGDPIMESHMENGWEPNEMEMLQMTHEKIAELESENAELKKYLKYARDDKTIRLKEIEVLEAKIVELRGLLEGSSKWANEASSFLKGKDELKTEIMELLVELATVIDVAIARGSRLHYEDLDYRERFKNLTGRDWEHENPPN